MDGDGATEVLLWFAPDVAVVVVPPPPAPVLVLLGVLPGEEVPPRLVADSWFSDC